MTRFTDTLAAEPLASPRRLLLRVAAATGLGLVSLAGMGRRAAAKKKKKCKKAGPVTCARVCPAAGAFAFHLFEGGDVCATGANPSDCFDCDSNSECSAHFSQPYFCVRDFTYLATGADGDFSGICGSYTRGICASFEPCVLGT